jgi:hypothetical protein
MKEYIVSEEFDQIFSGFVVLCFPTRRKYRDTTVCNCCCFLIFLIYLDSQKQNKSSWTFTNETIIVNVKNDKGNGVTCISILKN